MLSKNYLILLLLFIGINSCSYSQGDYLVAFRDKGQSNYTIDHPEAYLSPRALDRRKNQHIAINYTDLPTAETYVATIRAFDCKIQYSLKWENAIVLYTSDINTINAIERLPYVKSVKKINSYGPSTRHKLLDIPIANKIEGTDYGAATNQTDMIHIDSLHQRGYMGQNILIAMMDAGFYRVDANRFFKKIFDEGRVLYTYNFVNNNSDVYSSGGHGCNTFSCIGANIVGEMVGTAPLAKFLLFATEDENSETIREEYNWVKAAEVADSLGADVFSTSLGYTTFDTSDTQDNHTYADMNGHTTPIAKACNTAASKGILVINSAGNEGNSPWHYIATPADADSCVAVGAVTPSGNVASFSSRGPSSSGMVKPNVCAQGAPATVASTNGTASTNNGTSFSGPITAGAIACLRQAFPTIPVMALIDSVERSASYYTNPNVNFGYGIPNFDIAYKILKRWELLNDPGKDRLLVFPNAFHSSFTLIYPDLGATTIAITVYDMTGKKVSSFSFPAQHIPFNHIDLDNLQDLAAGIYIMKVNDRTIRIEKD